MIKNVNPNVAGRAAVGAPNRKQSANLIARQRDHALTVDSVSKRNGNTAGYHKPGSNQR